jgi:hypothetical protein
MDAGTGRRAQAEHEGHLAGHSRLWIRRAAITLSVIASSMKCGALVELVQALVQGHGAAASTLLVDALNIWVINVIIFTLWLWSTDRGGPPTCRLIDRAHSHFLFAQMTLPDKGCATRFPALSTTFSSPSPMPGHSRQPTPCR